MNPSPDQSAACVHGLHRFREMALCECRKQGSSPERAEGREGIVTVYDDLGQYVGCMGANLWRALVEAREAVAA